jgi:cation transport ATPase
MCHRDLLPGHFCHVAFCLPAQDQRNRHPQGKRCPRFGGIGHAEPRLCKWVAIAFGFATPIAYFAMNKWLESFAYKTELNWWIFALAGVVALGIALLTVSWQSWKAARRNPVEALRYE